MKSSRIFVGAFLSSALLAACSGNNALPAGGPVATSTGSLVPPGTANAPALLGASALMPRDFGGGRRPPESVPSRSVQDHWDGHIMTFEDPDVGGSNSYGCGQFCGTTPQANNDADEIVGYFTDSNYVWHAFMSKQGRSFTNFDPPGAGSVPNQGTVARSINFAGWIAGEYLDSNSVYHGFVRKANGKFLAPYDFPKAGTGPGQGTETFDINDRFETAGNYIDSLGANHGWVCLRHNPCASIEPPYAFLMLVCEQTCLNSGGTVVGYYFDSSYVAHGFARYPDGTIGIIDEPDRGTGQFEGTVVQSLNKHGDIAGYYLDSNSIIHGFILENERKPYRRKWITFDVPGSRPVQQPCAHGTYVFSINDEDTTTGSFPNAAGTDVGYSRTKNAWYSKFSGGSGTGLCQGTFPSTNNNLNDVTGWFTDANNFNHGFVWTPSRS